MTMLATPAPDPVPLTRKALRANRQLATTQTRPSRGSRAASLLDQAQATSRRRPEPTRPPTVRPSGELVVTRHQPAVKASPTIEPMLIDPALRTATIRAIELDMAGYPRIQELALTKPASRGDTIQLTLRRQGHRKDLLFAKVKGHHLAQTLGAPGEYQLIPTGLTLHAPTHWIEVATTLDLAKIMFIRKQDARILVDATLVVGFTEWETAQDSLYGISRWATTTTPNTTP